MRFVLLLASAIVLLASTMGAAVAGDRALLNAIGYSHDGRYFAFEEYGIEAGSGLAYSNAYILDLAENHWVVGTPIAARAADRREALGSVRVAMIDKLRPRVQDLGIQMPAQVLSMIGDGAPGADGRRLSFGMPADDEPGRAADIHTLELESFTVAQSGAPCIERFGEEARGFILRIEDEEGVREVHRDITPPRSRGCPVDYRLAGVFLPLMAEDISRAVALISVYKNAEGGRDRRFIAVSIGAGAGRS